MISPQSFYLNQKNNAITLSWLSFDDRGMQTSFIFHFSSTAPLIPPNIIDLNRVKLYLVVHPSKNNNRTVILAQNSSMIVPRVAHRCLLYPPTYLIVIEFHFLQILFGRVSTYSIYPFRCGYRCEVDATSDHGTDWLPFEGLPVEPVYWIGAGVALVNAS